MKKFLILTAMITTGSFKAQLNLSIFNATGSSSITCAKDTVKLVGMSSYTDVSVTYTWSSPSSSIIISPTIQITSPGTYTVSAKAGSLTASQVISIGINTVAPLLQVSPTTSSISCNLSGNTQVTLTALSPTVNLSHTVYSPSGASYISSNPTTGYLPGATGIYTCVLNNMVNGCKAVKNFTVTGANSFPTFSVLSPQNFTMGCGSTSVCSITIFSASTQPISGGATSYTFLPPGSSSVTLSGSLSVVSVATVAIPGTWTVITKDNTSLCETRIPVSIIQNSVGPALDSVFVSRNILDCDHTSALLEGLSSTPNITYNWTFPGQTGTQPTSTVSANAIFSQPSNTFVANYSLTLTNNSSQCKTATVVPIYQNLYKPNAAISSGGNYTLTCVTNSILLTNASTTGIPANSAYPSNLPIASSLWQGPAPQVPASFVTTYAASTQGTYTLLVKDLNNGCTSTATIYLSDTRNPPAASAQGPFMVACPNGSVNIFPVFTGNTGNYTYFWQIPPGGTGSGITNSVLTVSSPGIYTITITNTLNLCTTSVQLSVWACVGINQPVDDRDLIRVYPNPNNGIFFVEINEVVKTQTLDVYDLPGKRIMSQTLVAGKNRICLNEEGNGIYFIRLSEGTKGAGTIRVIKE